MLAKKTDLGQKPNPQSKINKVYYLPIKYFKLQVILKCDLRVYLGIVMHCLIMLKIIMNR